jgi:hypothetical protein
MQKICVITGASRGIGAATARYFWSFVQYRKTLHGDHRRIYAAGYYDIVAGPVPGDWKKQSVIGDSDQVSFHTASAVDVLNRLPAKMTRLSKK